MPSISGMIYDDTGAPASARVVRLYRRDNGMLLGETRTGDGSPAPADPYWDFVVDIMRGAGTHGANIVGTDKGTLVVTSGNSSGIEVVRPAPTFSNAVPGLQTTQMLFTSSTGASRFELPVVANIPANAAYNTEQTLEFFMTPTTDVRQYQFMNICPTSVTSVSTLADSFYMVVTTAGQLAIGYAGTSVYAVSATGVIVPGARHFMRICLSNDSAPGGRRIRVYVNGVLIHDITPPYFLPNCFSTINAAAKSRLWINARFNLWGATASTYFWGLIEQLRITHSVLRDTPLIPADPWPGPATGIPTTAGAYYFSTNYTGEIQRVVLDDSAGTTYNDLIKRAIPA